MVNTLKAGMLEVGELWIYRLPSAGTAGWSQDGMPQGSVEDPVPTPWKPHVEEKIKSHTASEPQQLVEGFHYHELMTTGAGLFYQESSRYQNQFFPPILFPVVRWNIHRQGMLGSWDDKNGNTLVGKVTISWLQSLPGRPCRGFTCPLASAVKPGWDTWLMCWPRRLGQRRRLFSSELLAGEQGFSEQAQLASGDTSRKEEVGWGSWEWSGFEKKKSKIMTSVPFLKAFFWLCLRVSKVVSGSLELLKCKLPPLHSTLF